MACVVSVINLKGGVGKSTLAMILSEYLAFRFEKRVLLIDMDAQANLSYIMAPDGYIQSQEDNQRTIYDFFLSVLSGQPRGLSEFVASPPLTVSNIKREFISALHRSRETLDMVISSPEVAQLDQALILVLPGQG